MVEFWGELRASMKKADRPKGCRGRVVFVHLILHSLAGSIMKYKVASMDVYALVFFPCPGIFLLSQTIT